MATFSIDNESHFGMPAYTIDTIIKYSDTSVIEIGHLIGPVRDTVINHPYCNNPNVSLDSMKKMYPRSVVFVGFEKEKKHKRCKKEKNKKLFIPFSLDDNPPMTLLILSILAIMAFMTYFTWQANKKSFVLSETN